MKLIEKRFQILVSQTSDMQEGVSGGNKDGDSVADKVQDEGNISGGSTNEEDGDDESTIPELGCDSSGSCLCLENKICINSFPINLTHDDTASA